MELDNARILMDAYNIELAQGTGLKTYSLSVVEALRRLGARPSLLASCGVSSEPVLQEALLLDAPRRKVRLVQRAGDLARSLRPFQTARPVGKPAWAMLQPAQKVYCEVEAIYATPALLPDSVRGLQAHRPPDANPRAPLHAG